MEKNGTEKTPVTIRAYIGSMRPGDNIENYHAKILQCADDIGRITGGATTYDALGTWEGTREGSTVIETLTEKWKMPKIQTVLEVYRAALNQESILVTVHEVQSFTFITGEK